MLFKFKILSIINMDVYLEDVFNKVSVLNRARENWDFKNAEERERCGRKYSHLFKTKQNWNLDFDKLERKQQILLIKGELIRTYDNLPNKDKTIIKRKLQLSIYSSKWFKLPIQDKEKLLNLFI